MFRIEYRPRAVEDLRTMRAYDRARIVKAIERHLQRSPHVMGGLKKRIERHDGNFVYQLSVGDFRIFYDVDVDVLVTQIQRVKHKGRRTTGEIL